MVVNRLQETLLVPELRSGRSPHRIVRSLLKIDEVSSGMLALPERGIQLSAQSIAGGDLVRFEAFDTDQLADAPFDGVSGPTRVARWGARRLRSKNRLEALGALTAASASRSAVAATPAPRIAFIAERTS